MNLTIRHHKHEYRLTDISAIFFTGSRNAGVLSDMDGELVWESSAPEITLTLRGDRDLDAWDGPTPDGGVVRLSEATDAQLRPICPECKEPWTNGMHEIEQEVCHLAEAYRADMVG